MEKLLSSFIGIHGAFPEDGVDFIVGVLLAGDFPDVLDYFAYIVGNGNPRRPTTVAHASATTHCLRFSSVAEEECIRVV